MEPLKIFVLSCCFCILVLNSFAHTADTVHNEDKLLTKDGAQNKRNTTKRDSNIIRVKRLHTKEHLVKQRYNSKSSTLKQQHLEQPNFDKVNTMVTKKPIREKKFKNYAKNSHSLNKKLLSKLGFTKVKAPNSHNRKRLAVESRRHASPDDSHMFIIKLPPNLHYYAKTHGGSAATAPLDGVGVGYSSKKQETNTMNAVKGDEPREMNAIKENSNGKKVLFPFSSNGRPGRIYHWNLPIIQEILKDKQRFSNVDTATKNQLIDIKDTPTWNMPWENEAYDKTFDNIDNHNDHLASISQAAFNSLSPSNSVMMNSYKKSLKRKSPTYYAPQTAVNKYFSGNGKPKGFYVIKENQKKPLYYKNIIS